MLDGFGQRNDRRPIHRVAQMLRAFHGVFVDFVEIDPVVRVVGAFDEVPARGGAAFFDVFE